MTRKRMYPKEMICEFCGQTYFANRKGTRFCNKSCSSKGTEVMRKEKTKVTMLSKHGYENYFQSKDFKEKTKKTCKEKYGVEYAIQSKEIKEKVKSTVKKNLGVEYAFQLCKDNKSHTYTASQKRKDTMLKKHGVEYSFQLGEVSYENRISTLNKSRVTMLEKYNTDVGFFCGGSMISNVNKQFAERLGVGEDYLEYSLGRYSYDIKFKDILIEINPTITHNSTLSYRSSSPKKKYYHRDKMLFARNNGYRCFMVFDWDDKEKIKFMLTTKKRKIYGRKTILREIDKNTANDFMDNYHLQKSLRTNKGTIFLGLYFDNELVQVCSFGKPRYRDKYEWELLRLCSRFDVIVVGGAKKMFKYFVKTYSPKNIVSYCDESKFSGHCYQDLGFSYVGSQVQEHRIYIGKKGVSPQIPIKKGTHILGSALLKWGFDNMLGRYFGKSGKGSNNIDLMINNGFVSVYDCGQGVYLWNPQK